MSYTIALTGKGGVGKTTISSLIIDTLIKAGKTPVLAVDADSNANLNEALGVAYDSTVGGIREEAKTATKDMPGLSKNEYLDLMVNDSLVEMKGYDLIVMGRPEGPGCYCYANNVLRDVIKKIADNYKYVVVDSEAGCEHIARRTLLSIDLLILVSDCSVRGVRTAKRISDLVSELGTPVIKRGLVINRAPNGILPGGIEDAVKDTGLELLAVVPSDDNVIENDALDGCVINIPDNSVARDSVKKMLDL